MRKNDIVGGVIVMLVGLVFLAGNYDFGLFGVEVDFGRLWPLILIVLGVAKMAFPEGESRLGGLPLVFVGGIFLAHNYDVMRIHQSWPLFIVAAGIGILAGAWSCSPKKEGQ
jgi:hypothetical protein